LGCTGGAALSGAGTLSFGYVSIGSKPLIRRSHPFLLRTQIPVQHRAGIESGRLWRVARKPSSARRLRRWYRGSRQRLVGSCLRQRCPRPWRPKGRAFARTAAREGSSEIVRIMAVPAAPHLRPARILQAARGPCPHPSSAPIARERAVADPSPVPLPHGG